MKELKLFLFITTIAIALSVRAKDHDHDHDDDHGHEAAGEGFELTPEAVKNFGLETRRLAGAAPWVVPSSARFETLEETNLYRVREGHYKRIDFTQIRADGREIFVTSPDLRSDDEVVVKGIGFLRIAELAAGGETPEGHSH